jgi:hypothetical protein
MVAKTVGASPVKRLLMETPSSASRPCPVVRAASMAAASLGRLATKILPVARSIQRKAGMPSIVPCRIPIWLTGVVAGSLGVHSTIRCEPSRTQRERVGRVPARTPHSSRGKGTPSAWTNTTPGIPGSSTRSRPTRRRRRSSVAVTASSVPAVPTHTNRVDTAATIQAARTEVHTVTSASRE